MRVDPLRALTAAVLGAVLFVRAPSASADPPWVERRMTLGNGEFAVGAGVGLADDSQADVTGTGLYLQVGYGIQRWFEVLLRDGVRFGEYGKYSRAEQYGRLYTTDGSVTPGPSTFGNPDLVLLFRLLDLDMLEIGAEAEMGFPVEPGTNVDNTFGVLATLHFSPWVRFDTGAFVTLTYSSPVEPSFVAPFELWFQTGKFPLWFGPLTALNVSSSGTVSGPFGVGAGYAINPDIDVRAEWLVPLISASPGVRDMGFGIGVEVRHYTKGF
jgi:hypothetical protein